MDKYIELEQIGRGSFGTVHKIRRVSDGKILVWKQLDYGRMTDKEKQLVVSEVNILRELRHPNILRYHDRIIDKKRTKLYIIVEYCEGGDLRALTKRCKATRTQVREERIWSYFRQLISALKLCHRHKEKGTLKPILHRDIKPANVFLDRSGVIKLGDFGLARALESESKFAYTNVGTPFYMSPEQTNSKKYDERSDIWALGCLLYELATLRPPFHASNQLALAMKINAGTFDRIPRNYSDDLHRVIRWMLKINPKDRPRIEDLENVLQRRSSTTKASAGVSAAAASAQVPSASSNTAELLRKREVRVAEREAAVLERERRLQRQEQELKKRENLIKAREDAVKAREQRLRSGVSSSSIPAARADQTSTKGANPILLTPAPIAKEADAKRQRAARHSSTTSSTATTAAAGAVPPAPTSKNTFAVPAPRAPTAAPKLRIPSKKIGSTAGAVPLGDAGNRKYHRRATVGTWNAQKEIDEILARAKRRSSQYGI